MEQPSIEHKDIVEAALTDELPPREFIPFIPYLLSVILVSIGTIILFIGFYERPWLYNRGGYYGSTGSELVYSWWGFLFPTAPILVLFLTLVLATRKSHLTMSWRRVISVGIVCTALLSLFPFYRITHPSSDLPLFAMFNTETLSPGRWLWSQNAAGYAEDGFYEALAGGLILTICAIGGLFGRYRSV